MFLAPKALHFDSLYNNVEGVEMRKPVEAIVRVLVLAYKPADLRGGNPFYSTKTPLRVHQ